MEGFQQGIGEFLVAVGVMIFIVGICIQPMSEWRDKEDDWWEK